MSEGSMGSERITYLIANYNHRTLIGDCIDSLKAQTDSRWLAIVADDASTDGSAEVISTMLDDRIRLLVNPENRGYIATLDRLIGEATTDIVAILDADDALEPEATAELLNAFAKNPNAVLVFSRFAEYDESLSARRGVYGGAIPVNGTAIIDGPLGAIRSFRRSAYEKTQGLDRGMHYAEDRDLVYKLEELAPPVFVDRVLYKYRAVPHSHARHPEKRETGVRNTRTARRAALTRRGVHGAHRLAAECAIACDYVASSHRYPRPLRTTASRIGSAAAALWRTLGAAPRRQNG
jgi:glycosyltransferase involved in cell wall biosynthesis